MRAKVVEWIFLVALLTAMPCDAQQGKLEWRLALQFQEHSRVYASLVGDFGDFAKALPPSNVLEVRIALDLFAIARRVADNCEGAADTLLLYGLINSESPDRKEAARFVSARFQHYGRK